MNESEATMTDTESKEVDLKPCPFCGNQPSISEAGHWAEVVISCNCHAVPQVVQRCVSVPNEDGKTFHYDHERAKREAIYIWNDRLQDNNTLIPIGNKMLVAKELYEICCYPDPTKWEDLPEPERDVWQTRASIFADTIGKDNICSCGNRYAGESKERKGNE